MCFSSHEVIGEGDHLAGESHWDRFCAMVFGGAELNYTGQ